MRLFRWVVGLTIISLLTPVMPPAVVSAATASEHNAQSANQQPPVPPFGPHFLRPPATSGAVAPPLPQPADPLKPPLPVQPPVDAVPAPEPALQAPAGPAFNWSKTENYLILGTDRRAGGTSWRTDTVIIVGLDRELGRAAVFSIPRDLYIQIPGYGWGRINQVDYLGEQRNGAGGGPALMSQVFSQTLGISTQHWVRLQMDGFVDIVDAIGGVTVHLDCAFYEPIFNLTTNSWDYFTLPAGEVTLDGETAYWFVRLRYRESDIGRGRRQRQFLWALRDQVMNANLILRLPELWSAFQDSVSTDLSLLDLIELARYGISLDSANVRAGGLTLSDLRSFTTAQGAAVLGIGDPARVRAIVEGVWDAPAMIDTNRQDSSSCPPLPAAARVDALAAGPPPPDVETGDVITPTAPITDTAP